MTNNVSTLKVVASAKVGSDEFIAKIREELDPIIDLSGDLEADLDLTAPLSEEVKQGPLTAFEKELFLLQQFTGAAVEDELIEIGADTAEQIAALARQQRVSLQAAAIMFTQQQPNTAQNVRLAKLVGTVSMVQMLLEWSIRQRFGIWTDFFIVRHGFIVYSYKP